MNETEKLLQGMSEEQLQALMATEFPADMVKEAEAKLAGQDLVDSLYAYGAYCADREVAESDDEQPLSKEASAEFEGAEAEILAAMDAAQEASGVVEQEDEIELQKTAQVCGAAMLSGYIDQIEKLAHAAGETPAAEAKEGRMKKLKGFMEKKHEALKGHYAKAKGHAGKHSGKAGLIAGAGLGALGAHMALRDKKGHSKKASELSVAELSDAIRMQGAIEDLIGDGIEKLAAAGEKAAKADGHMAKATKYIKGKYHAGAAHVGGHKGKYGAGAGLIAGAGGAALAHRLMKDKK